MLKLKTSLHTKIYESHLDWEIERFLDYDNCKIDSISTNRILFENLKSSWTLSVFPKSESTGSVGLKMKICNDDDPDFLTKLVKFEIHAEGCDNETVSPIHHQQPRRQGMHVDHPHSGATDAVWCVGFSPLGKKLKEFSTESFIDHEDLLNFYLSDGALKLSVSATIKTVEIVNDLKEVDYGDE